MAINVATLAPASLKSKNVATEQYVDTSVASIDISSSVNNSIASNNDTFAQKLGYLNYASMVANASSGKTVVVGGYMNTSLLQANSITANKINTSGLIAENINATDIIGKNITGGTIKGARIEGAVIMASYLDLNGQLQVLTNYVISVATRNSNPSYYTDAVYMSSTNDYRIPSLSSISEPAVSQDISNSGNVFNSKIRSYNCANAGHNLKCVKSNPPIAISSFLLFTLNFSSSYIVHPIFSSIHDGKKSNTYTIYIAGQHMGYYYLKNEYINSSVPSGDDSAYDYYGVALYFNGTKIRTPINNSDYTVSNGTFSMTIKFRSDSKGWDFYLNTSTNSVNFTDVSIGLIKVENNGGDTGLNSVYDDISTAYMSSNCVSVNNMV